MSADDNLKRPPQRQGTLRMLGAFVRRYPGRSAAALGAVFEVIRETNKRLDAGTLTPGQARALANWRDQVQSVLAFEPEAATIPPEIEILLADRAAARAAKNFPESDRLRDAIAALGWTVKDTKEGQKVSKT